jgi:hypothetical protein
MCGADGANGCALARYSVCGGLGAHILRRPRNVASAMPSRTAEAGQAIAMVLHELTVASWRCSRWIRVIGFLLAILLPWQAAAQQPCPTLVVSNTNDVVNGDTSSPCALIANPGADGISLREAVLAANNATGLGTMTITFAAALAGQTITPSSSNGCCYIISRDSVAIIGLVGASGTPTVTVDATSMFILFSVTASNFTLASMQIVGMGATSPGAKTGVYVRAGDNPGELRVSNTVIQGNAFSNNSGQPAGIAVVVGAAFPNTAPGAVFSTAVIANNTFTNFTNSLSGGTDAVKLQAEGANSTVQNVSIFQNTFTNVTYPIELVPAFSSGGSILSTRIVANSFSGSQTPIIIDPSGDDGQPSTGNTVNGTTIERNVFTGNTGPAIMLIGGIGNGSTVSATGNAITNTTIVDNLIAGDTTYGGISISGGRQESSQNSVSGVSIVNNTIANYSGCSSCGGAIDVNNNLSGGTNNTVSGVSVLNTILWNNIPLDFFGVTASQVTTSITAQAGFAGVNGNISANPQFVNPSSDFHLQVGSPAIGAGTSTGAPFGDVECKVRASPPAIGAYEPGNNPSCTGIVLLAAVLPASRSVEVGNVASAFASIINPGAVAGNACGLVPSTALPATFIFQTTDPTTNQLTGTPNTPVTIAAGATQSYVFGFTPSAPFAPVDVALSFTCANTLDAPIHVGLDTLLTTASSTPVPDLIAIGATPSNDGIVDIPGPTGTGFFAAAAIDIGASGTITATADDGGSGLPVTLILCQTDPSTGQCINPVMPGSSATLSISQNQTVTFTVFATGIATVPFDPANNRLYLRMKDAGGITRGATSVAVRTQ